MSHCNKVVGATVPAGADQGFSAAYETGAPRCTGDLRYRLVVPPTVAVQGFSKITFLPPAPVGFTSPISFRIPNRISTKYSRTWRGASSPQVPAASSSWPHRLSDSGAMLLSALEYTGPSVAEWRKRLGPGVLFDLKSNGLTRAVFLPQTLRYNHNPRCKMPC